MKDITDLENFIFPSEYFKFIQLRDNSGNEFKLAFDLYTTNELRIYSSKFSQYEYLIFDQLPIECLKIFEYCDLPAIQKLCLYLERYIPIIDFGDPDEYHLHIEKILIACFKAVSDSDLKKSLKDSRESILEN
jgi:hypothetical protein